MNRKSFTFIEVVMTVVILGIIAAVVITQMPDMQQMRLTQAVNKIQSDIRFAQRLAMQLQRRVEIIFDNPSDSYAVWIQKVYSPAEDWANKSQAKNPLTQQDFNMQLNAGEFQGVAISAVSFYQPDYAIMFDIDGAPYGLERSSPYASYKLSVADPAYVELNSSKNIQVTPNTGWVYAP